MLQGWEVCYHDTQKIQIGNASHTHSLSSPSHTSAHTQCSIRGIKMRLWKQCTAAPNVDKDLRELTGPFFSTESRADVCRAGELLPLVYAGRMEKESKQKSRTKLGFQRIIPLQRHRQPSALPSMPSGSCSLLTSGWGRRKPLSNLEHQAAVGMRGKSAEGSQEVRLQKSKFYGIKISPVKMCDLNECFAQVWGMTTGSTHGVPLAILFWVQSEPWWWLEVNSCWCLKVNFNENLVSSKAT